MRWLLVCLLGVMSTHSHADWKPPEKPDPSKILTEAHNDTGAGRFHDALAKHLWFHHNALKYRPSLYGVRLSFALGSWAELGKKHPPALQALKDVRDETGTRIREGKGNREDFHDFSSINEVLGDEHTTAELFVWLDQNNSGLAKLSYDVAQRALIQTGQYQLCGKYIDSKASVRMILHIYRQHQRMVKDGQFGPDLEDFANRSLANSAATLVALLVLNNRAEEADQVAAAVLKERSDASLKQQLDAASKGVVPDPWPKRGG
jgi:hypothetical protein